MPGNASSPSIQCSTGPLWALELEEAMDSVAEAGFTRVELMVTRDPKTQEPELPLALAVDRGLRITSVHGPFLAVTKGVWGLDPLEKIWRGVEMSHALGADTYIVHPPYLWERDYMEWVRHESAAFSAATGVKVAVETMYPRWVAGRRLRAHRWLTPPELDRAAPFVVIDTSHLSVAREDILDAYELLSPKLVHLHLSNNAGDGRDGHLELDRGVVPVDRLLAEVRRSGHAHMVSLEVSISGYIGRHDDVVGMLRRNRRYAEDRLSRTWRIAKGLPRG